MGTESFSVDPPETWNTFEHDRNSTNEIHNRGWGFEFDIEAMAKDSENQYSTFSENTEYRRNSGTIGDDSWFGGENSKGYQENSGSGISSSSYNHTTRDQPWINTSGNSNSSRWSNQPVYEQDEWNSYSSSSQGGVSMDKGKGRADEVEDVWGVRGARQWPARTNNLQDQNVSDEEPIDELTKYWATPNDYEVIRSTKRQHKPFSDTPTRQHDIDNWGSVPKPVMSYNGEGYTSDVLIEQSKKEFWSMRNGEWVMLNQSSDTKITHNQTQRKQELDVQPNAISSSFDINEEFELEPCDYEGEGFIDSSEWWKPPSYPKDDESLQILTDSSNPKDDDQDQELMDFKNIHIPEEPLDVKNNHGPGEQLELKSNHTPREPLGSNHIPEKLLDFQAPEKLLDFKSNHATEELLIDTDISTQIQEPKIHSDLALLLMSNPTATTQFYEPLEEAIQVNDKDVVFSSESKITSFPELRAEPPTSSSSLSNLGGPIDWINEIAKRTAVDFQENRSNHEKEWAALMEKQTKDSQKLEEFISQTTQVKARPKPKVSSSVSLAINIETKQYGRKELHVTGNDDLKALVDEFCERYSMETYEMAIWVTVARAVKKQKKKLRQQRAGGM